MSTLNFRLDGGSFPFPIGYPDPIMSGGSLVLMDFAAPGGYDGGSAFPANGDLIPNIAWETAATILGAGDRATLSGKYRQNGLVGNSSAKHLNEWTAKKGLHTIVSQSPGIANNDATGFGWPDAIANYVHANTPGHDFYISLWWRTTRAQLTTAAPQPLSAFAGFTAPASNFLYYARLINGFQPPANADNVTPNTLAEHFGSIKCNAWTGSKPGSVPLDTENRWLWNIGARGGWSGANLTTAPSGALYRTYVEDLTVSGRAYDTVRTMDKARFAADFGSGGRFFGDTFTNPTTIP